LTWRWRNIPVPQTHPGGLGAGIVLQVIVPRVALVLAGVWLGGWAVKAAAEVDLERPSQLVRSGPDAFSRNPMYVAWTLGYLGAALVTDAAWPLLLLPVVLVATNMVVVAREERSLERRFGSAYRSYKAAVRRYLEPAATWPPYSGGRCRWSRALSAAVHSAGGATAAQPATKSTP
jgi:hypothetical protein